MSVDAEVPIDEESDNDHPYEPYREPDVEPDVEKEQEQEQNGSNESDMELRSNNTASYVLAAPTIPRDASIKRNKKFANREKEAAIATKNATLIHQINSNTTQKEIWERVQKKKVNRELMEVIEEAKEV